MALPGYGKITGQFLLAVGDTADGDPLPDAAPAVGTVQFTPAVPYVANASEKVTIIPAMIECVLDAEGKIVDPAGEEGVYLIATDDTGNNPSGWTYTVRVALEGITPYQFEIAVLEGVTADLSVVVPVASSTGAGITRGLSAYEIAVQGGFVGTEAAWLQSLIGAEGDQGDKGDKGDKGDQGDEGPAGTVPQAEIDATVAESFEDWASGVELGYAERTTSVTGGNQEISGLSVTVVGKGRPVYVEFYCSATYHSVANTLVRSDIKSNGTIMGSGWSSSPLTTNGPSNSARARLVLTDGVSYTFTVGIFQGVAGSMTWAAAPSPFRPMWLSVRSA